jgi:hypothetical protein
VLQDLLHIASLTHHLQGACQPIDRVLVSMPADVVALAQERGRSRDLWATVEELLVELEAGSIHPTSD